MRISTSTFDFLSSLKKNNDREWFQEHKKNYEAARKEFMAFVDELISLITKFDKSVGHHTAKDCVFRIYRDVRFSKAL